ncbi:hypothetical protein L596_009339 [Steinernema carpocapsae]|uniref:Uncharacterized protein n=1 Tax=Steinernema carpocapsae TaxID=34508 RepID=A0A4U5PF22_STECR|nr:hypothetical protein L596_009339 [Steinernema carpocapsae]
MTPHPSTPSVSSTSDTADALIYSHIKRTNPKALLDIFPREKCRDLERNDHNVNPDLLKTMWKTYRSLNKVIPKPQQEENVDAGSWKADVMHERFCGLKDRKKSINLAIFHHFRSKMDFKALGELFDVATRKEFEKLMEKIDVPRIERMVAFRRLELMKPKKRDFVMIFKCRLCKKELKGLGQPFLEHVGTHEDIASYCFFQGCDKHFKSYHCLATHIIKKHDLRASELNSTQYHQLQTAKLEYYNKSSTFMDRYFPPESFNKNARNVVKPASASSLDVGTLLTTWDGRISALLKAAKWFFRILWMCQLILRTSTNVK